MKALFICLLVALLVLQEAFCQNGEALRRRRIRKKVIKQVIPEGLEDAQVRACKMFIFPLDKINLLPSFLCLQALLPEEFEQSPQSLSSDEEDRYARG